MAQATTDKITIVQANKILSDTVMHFVYYRKFEFFFKGYSSKYNANVTASIDFEDDEDKVFSFWVDNKPFPFRRLDEYWTSVKIEEDGELLFRAGFPDDYNVSIDLVTKKNANNND